MDPWVGKTPWRRAWQPTPVFLSGESREQRSLAGYSPWGHTESDMAKVTEHTITTKAEKPFYINTKVLTKIHYFPIHFLKKVV